jgi:hypothetical protein
MLDSLCGSFHHLFCRAYVQPPNACQVGIRLDFHYTTSNSSATALCSHLMRWSRCSLIELLVARLAGMAYPQQD